MCWKYCLCSSRVQQHRINRIAPSIAKSLMQGQAHERADAAMMKNAGHLWIEDGPTCWEIRGACKIVLLIRPGNMRYYSRNMTRRGLGAAVDSEASDPNCTSSPPVLSSEQFKPFFLAGTTRIQIVKLSRVSRQRSASWAAALSKVGGA